VKIGYFLTFVLANVRIMFYNVKFTRHSCWLLGRAIALFLKQDKKLLK